MSIATVNAFYHGMAPTVTNEQLNSQLSGYASKTLDGFCLPISDGSSVSFTMNFIDGTATLLDAPKEIFLFRSDPPAWYGSVISTTPGLTFYKDYGVGAVIFDGTNVQQCTTAGQAYTSHPTWPTVIGNTVQETSANGGLGPIWTCIGPVATATTLVPVSAITITTTSCLITCTGAGTSTYAAKIGFRLVF